MPDSPPSGGLHDEVRRLAAQASKPALPFEERRDHLNRTIALMEGHDAEALNRALADLIPALEARDSYSSGMVAMAIGALVESGADPRPACSPLRVATIRRMRDATRFARTWSAGDPGPGDGTVFIEGRQAQLGKIVVTPETIQPWAARDPAGARAWSRLDDWFLPIMAVARFNEECLAAIRNDRDFQEALDDLMAADWCICAGFGLGNSDAGQYVERLVRGGGLPAFADEAPAAETPRPPRERRAVETASDLFDDISGLLCKYCQRPDVVIRVAMDFRVEPFILRVVRHIRDPHNLFDTSGDLEVQLSVDDAVFLQAKANQYFNLTQQWENKQLDTTLSVYQDGTWSMGGSSSMR